MSFQKKFYGYLTVKAAARGHYSEQLFRELTPRLIHLAEHAYTLRAMDAVEQISQVLMNLPVNQARQAGLYYHALSAKRSGQLDEARKLFERLAETSSDYRARAIQTLGIIHHEQGQINDAMRYYLESVDANKNMRGQAAIATIQGQWLISAARSVEGDHQGALNILEGVAPLVRAVAQQHPYYFYVYNNELAYEMGKLGLLEQARNASRIALAFPYASAYPEWHETAKEIEEKARRASHSLVAVDSLYFKINNVVHLPAPIGVSAEGAGKAGLPRSGQPARLLSFQKWKQKMSIEKTINEERLSPEQINHMTLKQKVLRLLHLLSSGAMDDTTLDKLLEIAEMTVAKNKTRK